MLIIIDGGCSFCRWASNVLRCLCQPGLDIVPLDGVSEEVLRRWSTNPRWSIDSIKVVSGGKLFIKSQAVAEVMRMARWYAQPLRLVFLLPENLLDLCYDWIARNRKSDVCEL